MTEAVTCSVMLISFIFDSNVFAVAQIWLITTRTCKNHFPVIQCFYWAGYLSSPHADQEPPFARDSQQGPVISSPVVPAAASGTGLR